MANGDKTYSFDYKKEKDNKAEELFVDNHKIFEGGYYSLMKVGVMDNGMIVLDLSDVAFQAGTVRDYWDSNYSLVKKVNDVPFGTDLLASKYNYTKDMGYCIDDSYHEVTIAELTIVGNEFQEKIVRKDKVYNCAGLTY